MARVSLRRLIYKLQVACAVAADVCDHPIVYATLKQREALFRMGASREQVDKGFCSKAALDEFISDARAAVQAVRAVRMVFQPREIADGKIDLQWH